MNHTNDKGFIPGIGKELSVSKIVLFKGKKVNLTLKLNQIQAFEQSTQIASGSTKMILMTYDKNVN